MTTVLPSTTPLSLNLPDNPDEPVPGLRDEHARAAHLDARLGAILVVEVAEQRTGALLLPLSHLTMQAWMVNPDDERATHDPEEALNLVVQVATNDVNGHNEAVDLPDGRRIRMLTESVATPMLALMMMEQCFASLAGDLGNPSLCAWLALDDRPEVINGIPDGEPGYWDAVDEHRVRLAMSTLERHAMQLTFNHPALPGMDAEPGAPRRRL